MRCFLMAGLTWRVYSWWITPTTRSGNMWRNGWATRSGATRSSALQIEISCRSVLVLLLDFYANIFLQISYKYFYIILKCYEVFEKSRISAKGSSLIDFYAMYADQNSVAVIGSIRNILNS